MGIAYSPKIVTDGLVFYYDMGNTQKSWKGKPTTNFISSLGDPTAEYARGEFGQYFNFVPVFETNGLVPYTLSFDAKGNIPGSMLVYMQNGSYTKYSFVGQTVTLSTDWQRFTFQNLTPAGPTAAWSANTPNDNRAMLATFTTYGSGINPVLRNFQLELGSFATPFVNGTRSNTQAILDLTNNNTLTASSLTYASNNTFSFDRTNNNTLLTSLSITSTPALSNFTYEVFLNITSLPPASNNGVILGATYYSGAAIYWRTNGSNFNIKGFIRGNDAYRVTAEYTIALNTVYHVVLTNNYSAGTLNLYINGVLFSSVATATQEYNATNIASAGNIGINKPQVDGGGSETYSYFTGRVDTAKIYNRALTAQEVQQNFNALRGRYGI